MRAQDCAAHHAQDQKRHRRHDDAQEMNRQRGRLAPRTQKVHKDPQRKPDQDRKTAGKDQPIGQRMGCTFARQPVLTRAQCPRHQRPGRDAQSNTKGGYKKQNGPGITHRRRQFRFPQHRYENHIDKIDQKNRHQPHR